VQKTRVTTGRPAVGGGGQRPTLKKNSPGKANGAGKGLKLPWEGWTGGGPHLARAMGGGCGAGEGCNNEVKKRNGNGECESKSCQKTNKKNTKNSLISWEKVKGKKELEERTVHLGAERLLKEKVREKAKSWKIPPIKGGGKKDGNFKRDSPGGAKLGMFREGEGRNRLSTNFATQLYNCLTKSKRWLEENALSY